MKTYTFILISFVGLSAITSSVKAQPGFSGNVSFNTFYQQLSPYGQWLDVPQYGRVWTYSEPGFRPYATNGQWEETSDGWYWNSNYAWGSIPFHYGRWEQDPYYGWIWIPGYDYAPAWVVWSQAGDCYGWAPLGFGLDINVSFGRIPSNRWMYASIGNITRRRIDRYCIPYARNNYYYGRQQPIINVYTQRNVRYMGGPRRDDRYGNNRPQPQRPEVRDNNYGNRGGYNNNNEGPRRNDYSNSENRPGNNIHYDPSPYDRSRAIAGGRPSPAPDTRSRTQQVAPEIRQDPRPQINQRPPMSEPRINNQPRVDQRPQPSQPRVYSQPQRSEAPRQVGGRERRIF